MTSQISSRPASTELKSRFLASATGLSQNFADLIVAIHMYVRRFVGLMRMEVDAIWPHSQDRRHTLSISPFHEIEVAREARHNLGMHHLAKMCWVVSVFASKDNAELERLSSDEIRTSRWYQEKGLAFIREHSSLMLGASLRKLIAGF